MSPLFFKSSSSRYELTVKKSIASPNKTVTAEMARARSKVRRIRKWITRVASVLMIAVFGFMATGLAAAPAHADNFISDTITDPFKEAFCSIPFYNFDPEARGLGPNTANALRNSDKIVTDYTITAYEKYGMAGVSWTNWIGPVKQEDMDGGGRYAGKKIVKKVKDKRIGSWGDGLEKGKYSSFFNSSDACGDPGNISQTAAANFVLNTTTWVVHLSNMTYQTANESVSTMMTNLKPTVESVVTGLKDGLYLPFITVMIMLSALWMAWKGLIKKSSTEMAQGAIWMLSSAILGIALMLNPMFVPSIITKVVNTTTAAVLTTITSSTDKASSDSSGGLCSAETGNNIDPEVNADQRKNVRIFQCSLWYSFVYQPWEIGQFGQTSNSAKPGSTNYAVDNYGKISSATPPLIDFPNKISFGTKTIPANWALYQVDNRVNYPGSSSDAQFKSMLNIASGQLIRDDPNTTWQGKSSTGRITTAMLSLVAALGASVMILSMSFEIIIIQLTILVFVLLSPLFFLAGVHPGQGRKIALGWLEAMAGLAMKQVLLSVILGVFITLYALVLAASAGTDWLVSMILVIAISIAGVSNKKQILAMFGNISFGGNGQAIQNSAEQASDKVKGHASNMTQIATGTMLGGAAATFASLAGRGRSAKSGTNNGAGSRPKAQETRTKELAASADESGGGQNSGAGARTKGDAHSVNNEAPAAHSPKPETSSADSPKVTGESKRAGYTVDGEGQAEPQVATGAGQRPQTVSDSGFDGVPHDEIERDVVLDAKKAARPELPKVNVVKAAMQGAVDGAHARGLGGISAGLNAAKEHKGNVTGERKRLEDAAQREQDALDKQHQFESNKADVEYRRKVSAAKRAQQNAERSKNQGAKVDGNPMPKHRARPTQSTKRTSYTKKPQA